MICLARGTGTLRTLSEKEFTALASRLRYLKTLGHSGNYFKDFFSWVLMSSSATSQPGWMGGEGLPPRPPPIHQYCSNVIKSNGAINGCLRIINGHSRQHSAGLKFELAQSSRGPAPSTPPPSTPPTPPLDVNNHNS